MAAALTEVQGALRAAARSRTAEKWTMVGVAKVLLASALLPLTGMLEIRVMTTNCNPISAPAEEPTMT